jgi:2-polyprenyl-6-methoxyphenol hydroxylase-like FAD-dependent oxidoreductase
MCFGARAFFGYAPAPDGSIYWFANLPTPEEPSREILANIDSIEGKRRLLDLFWKDKIPAIEIIEATTDLRAPLPTYVLSSVPKLNRDRVVLLGDAAHAMSPSSGQGASMAIEDAVILAKCLRDLPVERALERYEALRRDRVERVAAYGERSSAGKAAGPVGRVLRDLALPFVLRYLAAPGRLAWMYDYRIDWNEHESSSASAPRTVPALR